jgi:hypothetical protein
VIPGGRRAVRAKWGYGAPRCCWPVGGVRDVQADMKTVDRLRATPNRRSGRRVGRPGRLEQPAGAPGGSSRIGGEVSFQGETLWRDSHETTADSRLECAPRLDSHSLKPGWPNE